MSYNMTKLTRGKALGMIAAGISNPDIAKELGVDQEGRNLEVKKMKEALRKEVAFKVNWKRGREKVKEPGATRWLKKAAGENTIVSANQLKAKALPTPSPPTPAPGEDEEGEGEAAERMGLTARRAVKKPLLSQKMLEKRVEWCLAHRDWTAAD